MTPSTPALLVCALVLCGLEDQVRSQRGLCAGNQCFAFFKEPEDFPGAQKSCKDSGGQMYTLSPEHVHDIVNVSGIYWVELSSAEQPEEEALHSCPSISVSGGKITLQREPCLHTRNGFLCQYTFEQPCSRVQTRPGEQVTYTTPMDFKVDDSETFPPGTIAVTVKVGGTYAELRQVCVSKGWMKAPWSCEVLGGGCDHNCNAETKTCVCPPGKVLHRNNISCTEDPCEENPCTGEGEECENTREGFQCTCRDNFIKEDGACVDNSICQMCEHMICVKLDGVYQCRCTKGFKVADNPTKCEMICQGKDCPAKCNVNGTCYCPYGYITDVRDGNGSPTVCTDINECDMGQCEHKCENLFGSYRCSCNKGFELHRDGNTCVSIVEVEEDGSGSTPRPYPTTAGAHPAAVPSYIKTGSVLGITVFMALCAALLFLLGRNALKHCGSFQLSSFKHPDINIFYLQQVTSETYKRLSLDKQLKSES
ncbi:thrombomodulin-like [Anoplopoma fimbria]|uniref:thrombomodulin-like n=1 Tax=Anoplopoma fimbria TaxID=229290 RepID=UPI0023EBEAE8|nr:thrombomodulin-like [Anoplopoma fimbria]